MGVGFRVTERKSLEFLSVTRHLTPGTHEKETRP